MALLSVSMYPFYPFSVLFHVWMWTYRNLRVSRCTWGSHMIQPKWNHTSMCSFATCIFHSIVHLTQTACPLKLFLSVRASHPHPRPAWQCVWSVPATQAQGFAMREESQRLPRLLPHLPPSHRRMCLQPLGSQGTARLGWREFTAELNRVIFCST